MNTPQSHTIVKTLTGNNLWVQLNSLLPSLDIKYLDNSVLVHNHDPLQNDPSSWL